MGLTHSEGGKLGLGGGLLSLLGVDVASEDGGGGDRDGSVELHGERVVCL